MDAGPTLSGHEGVTHACRIRCERSDVLGQLQSVQFSMQLRGVGMQLRVAGLGNAGDLAFKVVY